MSARLHTHPERDITLIMSFNYNYVCYPKFGLNFQIIAPPPFKKKVMIHKPLTDLNHPWFFLNLLGEIKIKDTARRQGERWWGGGWGVSNNEWGVIVKSTDNFVVPIIFSREIKSISIYITQVINFCSWHMKTLPFPDPFSDRVYSRHTEISHTNPIQIPPLSVLVLSNFYNFGKPSFTFNRK